MAIRNLNFNRRAHPLGIGKRWSGRTASVHRLAGDL